jgi:hypothetical protein
MRNQARFEGRGERTVGCFPVGTDDVIYEG